jgi:N6-adenosine-specific RNA methylase IME4/ParB-like chromosome segregation protein Spo0J
VSHSNGSIASARGLEDRRPHDLRLHAQAELVPVMSEAEFAAFRADVERRGILCPLEITRDGVVLDGRARLRAARELELQDVPVRVVTPEDELEHILLAALRRRQLSPSQRAALALELTRYRELKAEGVKRSRQNLRQGAEAATLPPRGKTREQVAAWAGVSARTVQDAATVQAHDAELFTRVKAGDLPAHVAAERVRRRLRDAALPAALPLPEGPFELLYADPPWQLGSPQSSRAPERHYPTMPLEEIMALASPVAEDACLFLWVPNCRLPEGLAVIEAWGFEYVAMLVWVKPSIGMGAWTRNRHETLLMGKRGRFQAPPPERRLDSVIEAARGRHSQKPDCVYELLERAYPRARKLELFARAPRPGWAAWGNEVEAA